jgi:hypothetical protein
MGNVLPEVAHQSESTAMLPFIFGEELAGGIANMAQVVVSMALQ